MQQQQFNQDFLKLIRGVVAVQEGQQQQLDALMRILSAAMAVLNGEAEDGAVRPASEAQQRAAAEIAELKRMFDELG